MDKLIEKYNLIFEEIFKIKLLDESKPSLAYKQYPKWDSLAQMMLIQRIEEEFEITIPFDEMICVDSYQHGLDYLTNKLK
ncbi:acyl carrier protein [Bacteroides oleiciplenus]|uniref:acyl carrier protein n=1 Tax=Bacteroides oleiciplenus TaxID=626931 RepID=UPI0026DD62FD|nr:acyl carrier protein [Bacteroides oleiciplenus]